MGRGALELLGVEVRVRVRVSRRVNESPRFPNWKQSTSTTPFLSIIGNKHLSIIEFEKKSLAKKRRGRRVKPLQWLLELHGPIIVATRHMWIEHLKS